MLKFSKYLGVALAVVVFLCGTTATVMAEESKKPEIDVKESEIKKDFISYKRGHGVKIGDKITLSGYGELHYNDPINSSADKFDFHRFVWGVGVDFTDWLILRSEIDFEHGATELELEFAYLDFLLADLINIRAGSILVPVGFLNTHHEPTQFYSVERPQFNTVVIPTTWMAGGAGLHGQTDFGLAYQVYIMESLDAIGDTQSDSFRGDKGLRNGRRKVVGAVGRDIAGVMRLDYKGIPGLQLGTSFWIGNTAQGAAAGGGGLTTIIEGDARYQIEGIELTAAGAWVHIQDAAALNTAIAAIDPTTAVAAGRLVPSDILGGYVEVAYNLFHHLWPSTNHRLVNFVRHERYNTQHRMPATFASSGNNNRHTTTFGLAYFPIEQVVFKFDYNLNKAQTGIAGDQFNAGFGYHF